MHEKEIPNKTYSFIPLKYSQTVSIDFKQRFIPATVFFGDFWQDTPNIAASILQVLKTCDIDTRKQLINSIVVSGGCAMIPGFMERLEEELLDFLQYEDEFLSIRPLRDYLQIIQTPYPRNLLT